MDSETIKKLETLIGEHCDEYEFAPDVVNKFNELTGNDWDGEDYVNYCSEYWSHDSLEAVVYALLHNGEYPPTDEQQCYFWKTEVSYPQSNEDICLFFRLGKYRRDKKKCKKFHDLPLTDICDWLSQELHDWERTDLDINSNDSMSMSLRKEVSYGINRKIHLYSYEKKCVRVTFTNVDKDMVEKIIRYVGRFASVMYIPEN